jgi:hypothetical protein
MHNDFITTVAILVAICFLIFIIISTTNIKKEGFGSSSKKDSDSKKDSKKDSKSSSSSSSMFSTSGSNGIAGNSESYIANIQTAVIKLQDTMLLSKYRTEYENTVMALEDLVNNLMLETALKLNTGSPQQGLTNLVALHNSKAALNEVMKFIDGSSS